MVCSEDRRKDGQRGEIMLEASIIMVSVIVLLVGLLSINFMFYQEAMMNSIATEIANDIAAKYKYKSEELAVRANLPSNADNLSKANKFRHVFDSSADKAMKGHTERAKVFAEDQIAMRSLGFNPGEVEVESEITRSGIGRAYVTITVSQRADFFLSGMAKVAGFVKPGDDGRYPFSATVKAECDDLVGYTSMANFVQYAAGKVSFMEPVGGVYLDVKALKEIIERIMN